MTSPKPGWYPDPAGTPELFRWWDGSSWTDAIGESPKAPAPSGKLLPEAAELATLRAADDAIGSDEVADRPRRRSAAVLVVALVAGFALFVTAALGFGNVVLRGGLDAQPAAGESEPAGKSPQTSKGSTGKTPLVPSGQVDETSGEATIGNVTMTFPGEPFRLDGNSTPIEDAFDIFFVANAPVHKGYNGRDNWYGSVGFAHIPAGVPKDAASISDATIDGLSRRFFGTTKTKLVDGSKIATTVNGRPALSVSVEVRYKIKNLPSRYDTVRAIVVTMEDGSLVAVLSSIPNDADPLLHQLAAKSLDSLHIQ